MRCSFKTVFFVAIFLNSQTETLVYFPWILLGPINTFQEQQ